MKAEAIDKIITECTGTAKAIQEAATRILMEETTVNVGDAVASVDEDVAIGGFVGKGVVKGFSEDKTWADVELPNGTKVHIQSSLLYLVGK